MEKMKAPFLEFPKNRFVAEMATVFLIGFVFIELISVMGLSEGVTSSLPYPIDKIMSSAFSVTGLLAVYGLLKNNWAGAYFALSTSTFEVVLGCFSLSKAYSTSQSNLTLTAPAATTLVLGALTLICIFKMGSDQPKMTKITSCASSLSGPETPSAARDKYTIETIDVAKKYFLGSNVVSAINGISMKVAEGEFIAIMGPSGSGKSTLLNLIGALDRPFSGRVFIDGVDISTLDELGLARLRNEKIGFVFQAYNLIARSSVLRNMELPALVKGYSKEERLERVNRLLAIVGLDDKPLRKPKTLSGGEQQRVAIARALINGPKIVLADEPTGNVDSKTGRLVMDFLRKLSLEEGTTVVVVTHDPEVAKMANRIIYIRDGKIVEEETVGGS